MLQKLIEIIRDRFSSLIKWLIQVVIGIAALVTVLAFLESQHIQVVQVVTSIVEDISAFLHFPSVPLILWLLVIVLTVYLIIERKRLGLVAGEFTDNFKDGLNKWEFGGEGWKIEQEGEKPFLSVSQSSDGGITKRGFGWSDYEFSFETKVINKNSGWIVRGENRNKYIMIQLWMEKLKESKLRLHYRIPHSPRRRFEWIVAKETPLSLKERLQFLKWIKVRIVVLGNNIDVYLNGEHCAHYFIPDPIRWEEKFIVAKEDGRLKEDTYITSITNYAAGKVGFRCSSDEHAHFRNVRVKPLF